MIRPGLQTGERSTSLFQRVCTALYLLTVLTLWCDVLYRQLWLRQPVTEFFDVALILTLNVVLSNAAILYSGGITVRRFQASLVDADACVEGLARIATASENGSLQYGFVTREGRQILSVRRVVSASRFSEGLACLTVVRAWYERLSPID